MRRLIYLGTVAVFGLLLGATSAAAAPSDPPVALPSGTHRLAAQQPPPTAAPTAAPTTAPAASPTPAGATANPAAAPAPPRQPAPPSGTPRQGNVGCPTTGQVLASSLDADVVLDIPNLSVDEITLDVERLRAV